jgi:hypothetical protein
MHVKHDSPNKLIFEGAREKLGVEDRYKLQDQ